MLENQVGSFWITLTIQLKLVSVQLALSVGSGTLVFGIMRRVIYRERYIGGS